MLYIMMQGKKNTAPGIINIYSIFTGTIATFLFAFIIGCVIMCDMCALMKGIEGG